MKLKQTNYQPWLINEKDFPHTADIEQKIIFLTGYGALAPSTHNTQPWLFYITKNQLKIIADPQYHLPEADPTGRNQYISLGTCALNVIVSAAHFGLAATISYEEATKHSGNVVLKFAQTEKVENELARLFPQITRRFSDKRVIRAEDLEPKILQQLQAVSTEGTALYLADDKKDINHLAHLAYQAAASYGAQPQFGRELSAWLRSNKTHQTDGMPGLASGLSNGKAMTGKTLMKLIPKSVKVLAKKYLTMLQLSPAVGVITTPEDTWQAWVKSGLAYERLALTASMHNISLSPVAAPIERPERQQLLKFFVKSKGKPQMFFRLVQTRGEVLHSPRRSTAQQLAEQKLLEQLKQQGVVATLHTKQVNSHRINYVLTGKGQPLLLLHGANIGWGQWLPNIKALAKHFQVIALDLPGVGGSSAADFRSLNFDTDFVETVAQFTRELQLNSVSIIGHSFGAAIALRLAQQKTIAISKLILMSPLGFSLHVPNRQQPATIYPFAKLLSRTALKPNQPNMASFLAQPLVNKQAISAELVDYFVAATNANSNNHPLLFMNSLTKPFRLKKELLLTDSLRHLKVPTLIIMGDKDPLVPASKVKRALAPFPQIQLEVFANTGHVPSLEQSDAFNNVVLKFLK